MAMFCVTCLAKKAENDSATFLLTSYACSNEGVFYWANHENCCDSASILLLVTFAATFLLIDKTW